MLYYLEQKQILEQIERDRGKKKKKNQKPKKKKKKEKEKHMLTVVSILGGIGSGKTSAIKESHNGNTDIITFIEPTKEWKQYLDLYYKNPTMHNCYMIQLVCLSYFYDITYRIEKLQSKTNNPTVVMVERSPIETIRIFVYCLKEKLCPKHFEELILLSQYLISHPIWTNALYIHLDCSTNIAYNRIVNRNDVDLEESDKYITKPYLDKLQQLYQILIQHMKQEVTQYNLKTIDTSVDNAHTIAQYINTIIDNEIKRNKDI